MTDPPAPDDSPAGPVPPAATPAAASATGKKHIYFGVGGLALGLAAGLVLGAVGGAVGDALAQSSLIPQAVEACSATDTKGVSVMDGGKSLNLQTAGKKSKGTSTLTVVCVMTELKAPESIFTKLESTRALDGTKAADWAGFTASWTYHPDDGLNIIVETAAQ